MSTNNTELYLMQSFSYTIVIIVIYHLINLNMMTRFIPVKYGKRNYPPNIISSVDEIAGHFGKNVISDTVRYSLHTEYSFTKRNFPTDFSVKYPSIASSTYRGIPLLWTSEVWSEQFYEFITDITFKRKDPEIIEIHPPFKDHCPNIDVFLDRYMIFEGKFRKKFPNTKICIENRAGSQYTKSRFLISSINDICELINESRSKGCNLKVAVDYPQLFTAYGHEPKDVPMDWFETEHKKLINVKQSISSVHLWGKRRNEKEKLNAHQGDLNSLFEDDPEKKEKLLKLIASFYDDGICRYFVPEVNSNDSDLKSIIDDCMRAGIEFTGEYYLDNDEITPQ